jgi:predicted RNase H-like nuclease/ppGpp synthetase/RelA/SpoT-type nucleotidyltranferase
VHYVGVDLAWGDRKPTGLAVLDDDGRLLHLSAATTDADIVSVLREYVEGAALVAVDAPLVVTNPTGNRLAERELNRDFARFDAGAHPANTGKPEFAGTPRGARLAELLDLEIDPAAGGPRRAIEVYPHAATVALFRLGRTLKYKNKPGRSLAAMRGQLLVLIGHLEALRDADPPLRLADHPGWRALVAEVETATRKSELRRAEDQVDAVVCAYVAAYVVAHPTQVTTYGDAASGAIVTPTLPGDLAPTPRPAPPSAQHRAVQEYATRLPALRAASSRFTALVTTILDDAGINYLTVTGRAKSAESFATKAQRTVGGVPVFADPMTEITDQIGVRVITYVLSDVTAVADLLADQLILLGDRDMGRETASEGRFGYASRHLQVALDPVRATAPEFAGIAELGAQVQIRTVLQHAWAEFEHDIRYKGSVPEQHAPDLDRRFTLAAGLLELADREFSTIRDRLQADMTGRSPAEHDDDPRIEPQALAAFLAGQYADAGWSRTDHYAWISGLLLELGVTSLEELRGVLGRVDTETIAERMAYRYPPGAVRRLDDALLADFGDRYLRLTGNSHRQELLRTRLGRLRPDA